MAAEGKPKEAVAARCKRHPRHRHSAGVCPFCLRDRLSRLSAAAASLSSSSAASSSPCSSGEDSAASAQAPPCRETRRARLGLLLRQEEQRETTAALGGAHGGHRDEEEEEAPKRNGFWARLQQQLVHHGSWHRKDGCSLAQCKAAKVAGAGAAPHKRGAALF